MDGEEEHGATLLSPLLDGPISLIGSAPSSLSVTTPPPSPVAAVEKARRGGGGGGGSSLPLSLPGPLSPPLRPPSTLSSP
uniref:Uncharacterized protein n=1 Tax=Oryza meridionalis TaxID=40149 RepID=A0A0E0DIK7_9ORYZ